MKTRLLLLDMHPILYRSLYAVGTRSLQTSTGRLSGAFFGSLRTLLALRKQFPQAYMLCAFDGGSSGRHTIYPDYKPYGDRPPEIQDQLDHLRAFCSHIGIPVLYLDGIEADDLIAIAASQWVQPHPLYHSMIVSSDTDFFQLVSSYITVYDDRAKRFYGPDEVKAKTGVWPLHYLAYKCLKGDVADHIPGIPGFGPVNAAKYAPAGLAGVPDGWKTEYTRNMQLMKLPISYRHMAHLFTIQEQRQYTRDLHNLFHRLQQEERHIQPEQAQAALDYYEVTSIRVEDFL